MSEQELEDMSPNMIWKAHDDKLYDHTNRIIALESTQENMRRDFQEIKDAINTGNNEQAEKMKEQAETLNTINSRLFDEYFGHKRTRQKEFWKFLGILVGGGSAIYILIEKLPSFF